ncbi:hypothetical protein C6P40_005276, partial [Pichia californica]
IENDEMISFISSSNNSLKLQESYERQFYTRQHDNHEINTIASVKSIFSNGKESLHYNYPHQYQHYNNINYTHIPINQNTNLDSISTFSGYITEDNVSTRPLISFSSDEEDSNDLDDIKEKPLNRSYENDNTNNEDDYDTDKGDDDDDDDDDDNGNDENYIEETSNINHLDIVE